MKRFLWVFGWVGLLLAVGSPAQAHMTSMGTLLARIKPNKRQVRLVISVSRDDMGTYLKLDRNADKRLSSVELQGHRPTIAAYMAERLVVSNNSRICSVTEQRFLKRQERMSKRRLFLLQVWTCAQPLQTLAIQNKLLFEDIGGYRHVGRIQHNKQVFTTVFSRMFPTYVLKVHELAPPPRRRVAAREAPSPAQTTSQGQGFWQVFVRFLTLGFQHILVGIDHIAFVLCLLVAARNLKQLVWVVSAFTIGHSITLVLSVLGWLAVPQPITEVLIAITIGYVAAENVADNKPIAWYRRLMVGLSVVSAFALAWLLLHTMNQKGAPLWRSVVVAGSVVVAMAFFLVYVFQVRELRPAGHRFWLSGLFGMIHGIGFSYTLKELKLPQGELVSALLSFNVGVELGQLVVVLVVFPWLYRVMHHEKYPRILAGFSALVGVAAVYWILMRALVPGG